MNKSISAGEWPKMKIKIQRKYNHLTDEQLSFAPGQEEEIITRLMKLIDQDRNYVEFMLSKMLSNQANNRL